MAWTIANWKGAWEGGSPELDLKGIVGMGSGKKVEDGVSDQQKQR